jgi:predicted phosphodiesterase
MTYAVISDIHGNLEALLSVIRYIESNKERIDKVVCLGDIVGYGADPGECIKFTREVADVILAGNHDFAVCEQTDIQDFNMYAKEAVLWSRGALNEDEINFLRRLPLKHEEKNIDFVHSSLHRPESWRYLLRPKDTHIDFQLLEKEVLFVGHTHVPIIFEDDGKNVKASSPYELSLNSRNKYIINPGSVGQPRDRDSRASFAIFDSDSEYIEIVRVDYDIKKAQRKILDAGLPEILATRLGYGG